jgi:predicted MFS family arabinose efflux permease
MFTEDILMVGADGMGIILAVSGIGAIAVSLLLASMPNKKRGIIMIFCGIILGMALLAFSFSTSWTLALVFAVFIGLGQTGQTAFGFVLVQYYVDPAYRGRAMSFMMMGFGLAGLGAFFGGILADSISIVWSIGGLALALLVLCGWMLLFSSRLRNLD